MICPDCKGSGKYVGLGMWKEECRGCSGTGMAPEPETKPQSPSGSVHKEQGSTVTLQLRGQAPVVGRAMTKRWSHYLHGQVKIPVGGNEVVKISIPVTRLDLKTLDFFVTDPVNSRTVGGMRCQQIDTGLFTILSSRVGIPVELIDREIVRNRILHANQEILVKLFNGAPHAITVDVVVQGEMP